MLVVPIAFAAVLALSMWLVAATLTFNRAAIVRALRMETPAEWRPLPPTLRAPRIRRVVRQRTVVLPEWRAAA